jgi:DNA-binding response OmpR family regulator
MTDEANKILVVDDSPQICKALNDILSASGYAVRTAPSGERALQIIETAKFDLVISDLKMTGMTGMDLAKRIFEIMPGVPVVILTGFGDMDSVISALRSGVADYLKKPFAIDEVLSVVKRELAKSQTRSSAAAAVQPAVKSEKPPRVYIFGQRDLDQIDSVLSKLRAQATAESALLIEQAGYVIAAKGLVNAAELEPLSNLIAGTRSTSASLASLLGETQDFSTSYMEGQRVSVYTTGLGRGLYLVVIVPKGTKQGLVWLYAKEAAVEIDRIVQRATETMRSQLGHSVNAVQTETLRKEMAAQKLDNVFDTKPLPNPPPPPRSSVRPQPGSTTITFKRDRPTPDVVASTPLSKATEPPRVEAPPPQPAPEPEPPIADVPAISFEEALKLGLLNFGEEPAAPEEKPSETEAPSSALTPDSFEEALKRGLFNSGSDQS